MKKAVLGLFAIVVSAGVSFQTSYAQSHDSHHATDMQEQMSDGEADSMLQRHIHPWIPEYNEMMARMHGPMMDGILAEDPDEAFVRGMIPHHQGAVEMAHTELKYGKDPTIRQLALDIIAAQEREIALMNLWLAAHSNSDEQP